MTETILSAKNLSVGYSQNKLISDLSFEIKQGELICLMGSNGIGKTTLLKTIMGMIPSLSGTISFKEENFSMMESDEKAKSVAVVLTERPELSFFSVYEIVLLGRTPYLGSFGRTTSKDHAVVREVIELLGLKDLSQTRFDLLSDGQKQKVMIGRALAQETPLLLLDEPTTFLDIVQKNEIMLLLKRIVQEKGVSILFTSHDWDLVLSLMNRVWLLQKDDVMVQALPEDLILSGKLEESFSSSHLTLNSQTGLFQDASSCDKKSLRVIGSGVLAHWLRHALKKEGFLIAEKAEDLITVFDGKITYKKQSYESIEQVLRELLY